MFRSIEEIPSIFGWFHTLFITLAIVGIIIIAYKKPKEKYLFWFLLVSFLSLLGLEIFRQIGSLFYYHTISGEDMPFGWTSFAFSLMPLFIIPTLLWGKNEKLKEILYTFLGTFGLFLGIILIMYPKGILSYIPSFNVTIMVQTLIVLFIGAVVFKTDRITQNRRYFMYNVYVFLGIVFGSVLLNILFNNVMQGNMNLFYLNPYINSPIGILRFMEKTPFLLYLITYILLFVGGAIGLFYLNIYKGKIYQFCIKALNIAFSEKHIAKTFIILYFVLNLILRYGFVNNLFFPNVMFFKINLGLKVSGFLGELAFMLFFLAIIFFIFKKTPQRVFGLGVVLIIHTVFIFLNITYSKYFNMFISFEHYTATKNPAGQMGINIFIMQVMEIVTKHQYFLILPSLVFVGLLLKHVRMLSRVTIACSQKGAISILLSALLLSFFTFNVFRTNYYKDWGVEAKKEVYGTQVMGLGNYYLAGSFLKFQEKEYDYSILEDFYVHDEDLAIKNLENFYLDPSLMQPSLEGIFKDKNIILVQIESLTHFALGFEEENALHGLGHMPNLEKLLSQSYYLKEFYDTTGLAQTSDAQFSVMNGLMPIGNNTLYWDHNKHSLANEFNLPTLFKEQNYETINIKGVNRIFYNLININKDVYDYDRAYFYEPREEMTDELDALYNIYFNDSIDMEKELYLNEGLDDHYMVALLEQIINSTEGKYFIHPTTMQPHAPFMYAPEAEYTIDIDVEFKSLETRGYLDYLPYIDKTFGYFIELAKHTNAVFIFYGDHGVTGLPKEDIESIVGKELSYAEYIRVLKHVPAFIYAPSAIIEEDIAVGLIKGTSSKITNQVDLYKTILDLFSLESQYQTFGSNVILNNERFSIDPKTLTVFFEDKTVSLQEYIHDESLTLEELSLVSKIKEYKQAIDWLIKKREFEYLKK